MAIFVRAASLLGYEELARSLGIDSGAELRRAGLSAKLLANPDTLIPYVAHIKLLERTARIADCPDFGLRLAQRQDIAILGPVAVLIRHAPTFGDALQLASRYLFAHSPAARFAVLPVEGLAHWVDLCFTLELPHRPPCAQTVENALGIVAQGIRLLAPDSGRPMRALLPHPRIGPLSSYLLTYGCECSFEMTCAALRIHADALGQPLREHNPVLQHLAQTYLDQQYGSQAVMFAQRVRGMVRQLLSLGQASQRHVSQALAIHPRTMQRRLREEGLAFEEILDGVRREQLLELLGRPQSPPLTQVAMMLGYAEQGALTRACRRWFGCPPSELRRPMSSRDGSG